MKITKIWAIRCASCIVMRAIFSDIEKEYNISDITNYDFDNDKEKFESLDIWNTLPVFIVYDDNNNELTRIVWEVSKKELKKIFEELN